MKDLIAKLKSDATCAMGALYMHIDAQAARIAELEQRLLLAAEKFMTEDDPKPSDLQAAILALPLPDTSCRDIEKEDLTDLLKAAADLAASTALQAPVREVPEADLWELLPNDAWYLDPPDGGNVSLMEQLRRMSVDAAEWRKLARVGRAPKWISVSDKLPEFRHECTTSGCEVSDSILIYGETEFGTTGCGFGHARDDGTWQCYEAEYDQLTVSKVTHWMPLPAAPVQEPKP